MRPGTGRQPIAMNISQSIHQRLSAQPATSNSPGAAAAPPGQGRCKLVQGTGSRPHYTSELQCHLRKRLRQAALIFGGAGVLLLLGRLLGQAPVFASDSLTQALHVAVVVMSFLVVGVLSGPWVLSLRSLRWI